MVLRIAMPRGDLKWQRFKISTPEGQPSELDFTNIYFTVKKRPTDKQFLIQKSYKRKEIYKLGPGDYQLKIDPADTNHLNVGEYFFDIQISYKNLLKESFVGTFVLKHEITYYENEDGEDPETPFNLPDSSDDTTMVLVVPDYHELELETPAPVVIPVDVVDYEYLTNLPKINGVTLKGDTSLEELGIDPSGSVASEPLTTEELDRILV